MDTVEIKKHIHTLNMGLACLERKGTFDFDHMG